MVLLNLTPSFSSQRRCAPYHLSEGSAGGAKHYAILAANIWQAGASDLSVLPQRGTEKQAESRAGSFIPGEPPAATLRPLQRKFDRFRHVFNHERPHEGLNNETWQSVPPSTKMFPRSIAEYVYPNGFITRRVNNSGDISWHKDRVFISEVFRFDELGHEEVEDGFYKVFLHAVEIGEFDLESLRFRPMQVLR